MTYICFSLSSRLHYLECWEGQRDTRRQTQTEMHRKKNSCENVVWWTSLPIHAPENKNIDTGRKKWENVDSLNDQHSGFHASLSQCYGCLPVSLLSYCWENSCVSIILCTSVCFLLLSHYKGTLIIIEDAETLAN